MADRRSRPEIGAIWAVEARAVVDADVAIKPIMIVVRSEIRIARQNGVPRLLSKCESVSCCRPLPRIKITAGVCQISSDRQDRVGWVVVYVVFALIQWVCSGLECSAANVCEASNAVGPHSVIGKPRLLPRPICQEGALVC